MSVCLFVVGCASVLFVFSFYNKKQNRVTEILHLHLFLGIQHTDTKIQR